MARVTLEDVADRAGVSFKTVSRVLNNEPNVSPETAERVRAAIADLHYVPNFAARRLSSGKSMSIGLVLGWPVNSTFSSTIIDFALQESKCHGYSLALFSLNNDVTSQVTEAFLGKQVDGIILDTVAGMDEGLRRQLKNLNVPYVVIHPDARRGHRTASFVSIDDQNSAQMAVNFLIELGHCSIAYLCYSFGLTQEDKRLNGYRQALADSGIPYRSEWVHAGAGTGVRMGFQAGFTGVMKVIPAHPQITAIFAATDDLAMGSLVALWQLGYKIPEDISVIGFDDIPYASMLVPPLTTVHQPIDEIASTAVNHLIQRINNPSTPLVDIVMPTRLVVRETCRPLR